MNVTNSLISFFFCYIFKTVDTQACWIWSIMLKPSRGLRWEDFYYTLWSKIFYSSLILTNLKHSSMFCVIRMNTFSILHKSQHVTTYMIIFTFSNTDKYLSKNLAIEDSSLNFLAFSNRKQGQDTFYFHQCLPEKSGSVLALVESQFLLRERNLFTFLGGLLE